MPNTLETLSHDLAAAVDTAAHSVVALRARRRIPSTGVVWRPGLIVAANHTVRTDDEIPVGLHGDAQSVGSVAGRDPTTDLCIVRFDEGANAPPLTQDPAPARPGQLAMTVGRPGQHVTASLGVVSAAGPAWRTPLGGRIDQFVRLDVAIYDGFSGSPFITASGRVAGICTSAFGRGTALVIPTTTVIRVVDTLLANGGVVPRGYLGISTQLVPLPEAVRKQLTLTGDRVPVSGLMIVAVEPETPAERAGLMLGDLLVGLDDSVTEDPGDVLAALGPDTVGRAVRASIVRAGRPIMVPITADAYPVRSAS